MYIGGLTIRKPWNCEETPTIEKKKKIPFNDGATPRSYPQDPLPRLECGGPCHLHQRSRAIKGREDVGDRASIGEICALTLPFALAGGRWRGILTISAIYADQDHCPRPGNPVGALAVSPHLVNRSHRSHAGARIEVVALFHLSEQCPQTKNFLSQ